MSESEKSMNDGNGNGHQIVREEAQLEEAKNEREKDKPWPFLAQFTLAMTALLLAGLLMVGLPVLSVEYFAGNAGDMAGPEFLTIMVTTLVGLTTMTVAGIFLFMTLRIDRGVRHEVRWRTHKIATDEVNKLLNMEFGIRTHITDFYQLLKDKKDSVEKYVKEVKNLTNNVKKAISSEAESAKSDINRIAEEEGEKLKITLGKDEKDANRKIPEEILSIVKEAVEKLVVEDIEERVLAKLRAQAQSSRFGWPPNACYPMTLIRGLRYPATSG